MKKQDIYSIAMTYREAILEAKYNGEFNRWDRMSKFPSGCCDDSCDLLAHYLYTAYNVHTKQGNGIYRDNNPHNTTNHAWLVMDDSTIIDVTVDQFDFFSRAGKGVYVGAANEFYRLFEHHLIHENYSIMQSARLWNDYQIIMRYIAI